jgi:U3 small nucleolar RNA-associated protein 12
MSGLVKSYLRYEHRASFGVVSSPKCNVVYDPTGKLAFAGALEDVLVWNLRQGSVVSRLPGEKAEVVSLARSPDKMSVCAGYADGAIRIFDFLKGTLTVKLHGHKKTVGCLRYNSDGSLVVSGSRDTDIIIWDTTAQTGVCRLRGHKDEVTDCKIVESAQILVSSSKDTLLKVWDLATQHCVQTLVGHRTEIWSFDVNLAETQLVTGTSDNQLRVWAISADGVDQEAAAAQAVAGGEDKEDAPAQEEEAYKFLKMTGAIELSGASTGKVVEVRFNEAGDSFGCLRQGAGAGGQVVEVYKICTEKEVAKKIARRKKRIREKQNKRTAAAEKDPQDQLAAAAAAAAAEPEQQVTDELELTHVVRSSYKTKVRSFDFLPNSSAAADKPRGSTCVLMGLLNNTLEVHDIDPLVPTARTDKEFDKALADSQASQAISLPGHRADARAVALSSDDSMLLSCSSGSVKIWNMGTRQCIRTMAMPSAAGETEGRDGDGSASNSAVSAAFLPGDRYVLVGTKGGNICLFELGSGECVEQHEAHEGAVWSLAVRPDKRGFVSGAADKDVKFWMFEMLDAEAAAAAGRAPRKALSLSHTRTLKMADDVLCVRYSHSKKAEELLLAVALLDSTVKIFYEDSLKFFLSLYGHKLPVMSMDISSDNTMLVTASADKNVKIWGLDFGDCHRSLFAHSDSVMAVQFMPDTHHFVTAGKDGLVKYWDGDSFEEVLTMDRHHGEVWALAVSSLGDFVVSGSHDRSIRVWERTQDQVFLEEEAEKKLEKVFDEVLEHGSGFGDRPDQESASATRRTKESTVAGERLIEALDIAALEREKYDTHASEVAAAEQALGKAERKVRASKLRKGETLEPLAKAPSPNMMMLGLDPHAYILKTLNGIKRPEMEEALLVLPFHLVQELLDYLTAFVCNGQDVDLAARVVFFVLKVYQSQVVSNQVMVQTLGTLRVQLRKQLQRQKDAIGFNLAGMRFLKRSLEDEKMTKIPLDISKTAKAAKPKKQRKN